MLNLNLNEGFVMRKILISLFAVLFASATANAETRIGISGAYTMFESSGTEIGRASCRERV